MHKISFLWKENANNICLRGASNIWTVPFFQWKCAFLGKIMYLQWIAGATILHLINYKQFAHYLIVVFSSVCVTENVPSVGQIIVILSYLIMSSLLLLNLNNLCTLFYRSLWSQLNTTNTLINYVLLVTVAFLRVCHVLGAYTWRAHPKEIQCCRLLAIVTFFFFFNFPANNQTVHLITVDTGPLC